MHTVVYECTLKRKFDIDDKKSNSTYSDPDEKRVSTQLQKLSVKQTKFAVKVVRDNDQEKLMAHEREFEILKKLNHPNIVRAEEIFKDDFHNTIH